MSQPPHIPKSVEKPWGHEIWFAETPHYLGKILHIRAGRRLSMQKHVQKHESLVMLSGRARLLLDGQEYDWLPRQAIEISPGTVHRFEALEDTDLLEVSTHHPDDVIRLSDDYGRTAEPSK